MPHRPRDFPLILSAAALSLAVLFSGNADARAEPSVSDAAVQSAENLYADLIDDAGVVNALDSGLFQSYQGRNVERWLTRYRSQRPLFLQRLGATSDGGLSRDDERALRIMRDALEANLPENLRKATYSFGPSSHNCSDAARKDLRPEDLRDALYACFQFFGNNLKFEGRGISRDSAISLLGQISEPERRKALFFAFQPLWESINGKDEPDSPYRRRIREAADGQSRGSAVEAVCRDLSLTPSGCEAWLVKILETWSEVTPPDPVEPWDYRYYAGSADRSLTAAIATRGLLSAVKLYYHDLGADLDKFGVLFDLQPRANKAPITYTNYITMGRMVEGKWRATRARVSANFSDSGLYVLNMLMHESGHAVHYMAIRNRPAFMDIGDDFFCESFADVTSWDVYEPAWQRKYLGQADTEGAGLRSRFTMVTLESAWALFDLRMLNHPSADPNEVWTEITSRYMHIVPHPEISWWAQRVQLVTKPGFMMNYGLGAVVTADIRQHIQKTLGPFNAGDPRWYAWVSQRLLRAGLQYDTAEVLRRFLGRAVSLEPLLEDMRRIKPHSTSTHH